MILLSHPTANQNVRQAALAFARTGLLSEFWTCITWQKEGLLDRLAPGRLRKELRRRSFPNELTPYLRAYPAREWLRLIVGQLGWSGLGRNERSPFSVDAVYLSLDRRVARRLASCLTTRIVYAYDAGALETFKAARERGLICIYEHPIVHWRVVRQIQREEAELQPEWAPTLGALADSEEKLARKDEELARADLVITASTFAKNSLAEAPTLRAPVRVLPYGTVAGPLGLRERAREKLHVLFVGALTQAKGLGYLLEAAARLEGEIELTLIGRRVDEAIPTPAVLAKHRWFPSLPHEELLLEMKRQDVLVLPSLHEGFGLVLGEAMAQGLVVITTPHTAGPDLITDSVDGFLIPIRSSDAIEEKLRWLHREPDRLEEMQAAAQRRALDFSWENYRQGLVEVAREVVGRELDS